MIPKPKRHRRKDTLAQPYDKWQCVKQPADVQEKSIDTPRCLASPRILSRPSSRVGVRFLNRSPCDGRSWKVSELGRGVVPTFWGNDMDVVTAYLGKLPGFRKCRFGGLPPVRQLAVPAHAFDGEAHFFFFLFFFMVSAWARNASAKVFI